MNRIHNDLLSKMYQLSEAATKLESTQAAPQKTNFGNMLKNALDGVNDLQMKSSDLKTKFDSGDKSVSLAEVMIASEKASIGFQATLQVRNKLLRAYQDIMNMPI